MGGGWGLLICARQADHHFRALPSALVRVLVVSNMLPSREHPERGRFVRDQVAALRELEGLDVECYEFAPGAKGLPRAAADLRRRYRGRRFDVVHAHFGLTAWPAFAVRARARGLTLHGTDLAHPRTRLATRAALPFMDLVAAASQPLIEKIPGRRAHARAQTLPCGVDIQRFIPMPRPQARAALELPADAPLLLFPADPARPEKRYDRARALADAAGARLLTLGGVAPERVPLYVNAANAVIVPSEREGFGLAALEALACDVPVLATPVGIHRQALDGLAGSLCAQFDLAEWAAALAPHLARPDPRVAGR
ncbi:MAG TPA: glycosyltransferase, partial [Solirubrobacteraceae bacterium]|nr:glycosyltransferase [Solirubrobacteraceae bacterium]